MSRSPKNVSDALYLIAVIDDRSNSGSDAEMVQITAFNDRLRERGQPHFAAGLAAPERAQVIDNRGDTPVIRSGAFHASTHHMSGFWIISAPDDEAATALATEASRRCNRMVELRAFHRAKS